MNLLLLISTLIVIGFLFSTLLFIFTPVKEVLPVFNTAPSAVSPAEYRGMQIKLDSLERIIEQQKKVENSLRKILSGNADSLTTQQLYQPKKKNLPVRQEASMFQFASINVDNSENQGTATNPFLNANKAKYLLMAPVSGYISRGFDAANEHYAIDIVTQKDAPVNAVANGFVIFSEWSATTGNVIILQHPDNLLSVYKHNSVLLKKVGSYVRAGEVIALTGNSGEYSTGPHLHFELWSEGNPLDPEKLISF